ncbi:MAG TPA: translation initiation factor IF-3 [Candidatus Binatia bacterium]|nr:translation initiation factor IF-3 [Candidatus Binatia bacterium]
MNQAIRASNLRVIGDNGQQLGVLTRAEALEAAESAGLDIVVVSPEANPPVAKIVDWGKYNYQRTKLLKKNRAKSKPLELKQMRLGLKISSHDLDVKMTKVRNFLEAGHKVKITLIYRGRELAHKEVGDKLASRIIEDFGDTVVVDQAPVFAGRQLSFVVRSKSAKAKNP